MALSDLQQRLDSTHADVRWVRPKNIHLTLAFIGDLPLKQIEILKKALNASVSEKAFEMPVAGTGTFGKEKHPRVFWVGIAPCSNLEHLHQQTIAALNTAGVPFDEKPFAAHLTLGRVKSTTNLMELKGQLEKEQSVNFGSTTVHEMLLMQSELTPEGARYSVLHRIPLQGGTDLSL